MERVRTDTDMRETRPSSYLAVRGPCADSAEWIASTANTVTSKEDHWLIFEGCFSSLTAHHKGGDAEVDDDVGRLAADAHEAVDRRVLLRVDLRSLSFSSETP